MIRKFLENNFFTLYLYFPLLLNFKERSYIAYDEGFYALQAKWIIQSGNWIAPMWWSEPVYDRTIGVQWLIAGSQIFFGNGVWAAHIPSFISGIITLLLTYKISSELTGLRLSWLSPLILSITYLWFDYFNLATQDMPLLALELVGVYSLIILEKKNSNIFLLLAGLWIGPALLLKSFMVLIPLISLIPYILIFHKGLFKSRIFYIGLIVGLLPLIIWILLSINNYGLQEFSLIYKKVSDLSHSKTFGKSAFYYLWNVPVNTFPWSIFAIIGFFVSWKSFGLTAKYILVIYPISILILLSCFNTKTPYYALQVAPLIAINASLGLQNIFNNKSQFKNIFKHVFIYFGLTLLTFTIYNIFSKFIDVSDSIGKYNINAALLAISFSWISLFFFKDQKNLILSVLIGPYIAFCLLMQSGLMTDRSPSMRIALKESGVDKILVANTVNVVFTDIIDNQAHSRLIKLALRSPNIGKRLHSISEINKDSYAWVQQPLESKVTEKDLKIVFMNKSFYPWVLVYLEP